VAFGGTSKIGPVALPTLAGHDFERVETFPLPPLVVVNRVSGHCSCFCHGMSCHTLP
jgi:hypothetical protein